MNQVRLVKKMAGVAAVVEVGVGETRRGAGLGLLALVDGQGWGLVVI